jgi:hypothetical protein
MALADESQDPVGCGGAQHLAYDIVIEGTGFMLFLRNQARSFITIDISICKFVMLIPPA